MKKILIITLSLSEKNGIGRESRELAKKLCQKYQLIIFSGKEDDDFEGLPNCRIFRNLPGLFKFFKLKNPFLLLFYGWQIFWKSRGVDFVHCIMDYPYSDLAALVALLLGKPLFSDR